eukprot:m.227733 g.227733  ORF g.227733 m.227733 type:complete len:63 (-) comp33529_c0_seq18:1939-2127(-)
MCVYLYLYACIGFVFSVLVCVCVECVCTLTGGTLNKTMVRLYTPACYDTSHTLSSLSLHKTL